MYFILDFPHQSTFHQWLKSIAYAEGRQEEDYRMEGTLKIVRSYATTV